VEPVTFVTVGPQKVDIARAPPHKAASAGRAHLTTTGFPQDDLIARLMPGVGYGYWESRAPREDKRDHDAIEAVANAFNRAAFRTAAIQEASFSTLQEALDHTAMALATGQLVTRIRPEVPFSVVPDHLRAAPAFKNLSRKVAPLLDQARGVLARLDRYARELDAESTYLFTYNDLCRAHRLEEARQLLDLMDEMDEVRNKIIRHINRALKAHDLPPFPLIKKSSAFSCRP